MLKELLTGKRAKLQKWQNCKKCFYFQRESNSAIVQFMTDQNITQAKQLETYYLSKLFKIIESNPAKKSYAGNF
jgi:hypothetical protein